MAFILTRSLPVVFRYRVLLDFLRMRLSPKMAPSAIVDKESFKQTWQLFALRVPPKLCNHTRKALKPHVLTMPRVQSVLRSQGSDDDRITLLLRYLAKLPEGKFSSPPKGNTSEQFVEQGEDAVVKSVRETQLHTRTPANVAEFVGNVKIEDLERKEIVVGYGQWSLEAVLRNLLPEGVTVPTSFETIGHIVHLNLRDEHVPHKKVIGEVMLDKLMPRIKTVVNKLQSTGGPFRTFEMEVLAGEDNLETTLKENGCTFRLDFRRVYWNSRLETEHKRIIHSLKADDVLADAFCGIGPFAVPAARLKKCAKVYANDLNPTSVEFLRHNAKANRVDNEMLFTSCGCARDFLRRIVREEKVPITRVVMNFPSGAPEFLDVFRGLYDGLRDANMPMPVVNCYCFVKGVDDMDSAKKRVRASLFRGESQEKTKVLPDALIDVRDIRDVAPRKRQVCVTFRVPEEVAYSSYLATNEDEQPPLKKIKAEG